MENILRDCAERLISAANSIVRVPAGQTASSSPISEGVINNANNMSVSSTPSSVASVTTGTSTSVALPIPTVSTVHTPSSSLALQEHRRIFGYRPPATARSNRQSHVARFGCTSTRSMVTPYTKKSNQKNTFTKTFVCLSNVNQCCPPSAAERIKLSLAGLGEQKISFQKDGDSAHVHEKPSLVW